MAAVRVKSGVAPARVPHSIGVSPRAIRRGEASEWLRGIAALLWAGMVWAVAPGRVAGEPSYGWLGSREAVPESLAERIPPPEGFRRLPAGAFAAWLRGLPLLEGRPEVLLFDGTRKRNQTAHHAVLDLDVGARDLQQCADAVIRLRAEFLYAEGCAEDVVFRFTSGDAARWTRWRDGWRPRVRGSTVTWDRSAATDGSWRSFRSYLETVFTYAGSYSLERELERVADPTRLSPGDVFIQGGFPGHAVLVVDVVENEASERRFLLAQSYMPAQQVHVLRNPASPASPWYEARRSGALATPEWRFDYGDLRRFQPTGCDAAGPAGLSRRPPPGPRPSARAAWPAPDSARRSGPHDR